MQTRKYAILPMLFILFSSAVVPFSYASVESEAQEDIQAGCPHGEIMVYRIISKQYVCVVPSTADRWVELGLADIISEYFTVSEDEIVLEIVKEETKVSTPPPIPTKAPRTSIDDSECRDGYTLVYRFIHHDSFCTSPSTAASWEKLGLAEIIEKEKPVDAINETREDEDETREDEDETREDEDETREEPVVNIVGSLHIPQSELHELNDRIWVAVGYDYTNSVLIEGNTGIIVIDSLSSYENSKKVLKDFRQISEKPIKTIIFTKLAPGYVEGSQAFIEEGDGNVETIIHEELLENYNEVHNLDVEFTHPYTDVFNLDISGVKIELARGEGAYSDQTYILLPDDKGIMFGDSKHAVFPVLLEFEYFTDLFHD